MKWSAIVPIAVVFLTLAGCNRKESVQNQDPLAPANPPATTVTPASTPEPPDEALLARQADVLKRIDQLTNEEADTVCLKLELIPREQILDQSVQPKNVLRDYTKQARTVGVVDEIEKTINEPKRYKPLPEN